jgi:hypothetical protein
VTVRPWSVGFWNYFNAMWVQSNMKHWRVFDSRLGVATTNNPVESFNSHFKKTHLSNLKTTVPLLLGLTDIMMLHYHTNCMPTHSASQSLRQQGSKPIRFCSTTFKSGIRWCQIRTHRHVWATERFAGPRVRPSLEECGSTYHLPINISWKYIQCRNQP